MLQLLGILIITNTLICSAWFYQQDHSLGAAGLAIICISLVTGLALTFHERAIEITFGKFASLKAAAQQATADAKEIAGIRQRVEAQAATLDLVAKASADSTKLLADLREANIEADKKLSLLDEKTASIVKLPDGRTKIGSMITGVPTELQNRFQQVGKLYQEKKFSEAYPIAQDCVRIIEETTKQEAGTLMTSGGLTPQGSAMIYTVTAELAQRNNDHEASLTFARKALEIEPSAERKALLVTALINTKNVSEAETLVKKTLDQKNEESARFQTLLEEIGVLRKQ